MADGNKTLASDSVLFLRGMGLGEGPGLLPEPVSPCSIFSLGKSLAQHRRKGGSLYLGMGFCLLGLFYILPRCLNKPHGQQFPPADGIKVKPS